MAEEVLSQDEVDALAEGVTKGDIAVGTDNQPVGEVSLYDFYQPAHLLKARLPSLDKINTRISTALQKSLFGLLQKYIEISSEEVELVKYADYLAKLPDNTSINRIKIDELSGTMLFTLEPKLVFMIVESFFGGRGESAKEAPNREYTAIERRIIERVSNMAVECITPAWRPVYELHLTYRPEDTRMGLSGVASSSDVLAISRFTIKVDEDESHFCIVIPYPVLEPIKTLLASGNQNEAIGKDDAWGSKLMDRINNASIDVNSIFAEAEITLKDLLMLKAGDFIPIAMKDTAKVYAGDTLLFKGKIGVSKNKIAVKQTAWCKQI